MSEPLDWIVYILECADQTLYTGITNDLDHRIHSVERLRDPMQRIRAMVCRCYQSEE